MPANDDHFLLWAVSGIIGVLTRDIYSVIAKMIGLAKFYVWTIGADIFVEPALAKSFQGSILGFLVDFVTGSLLGAIIGLLIDWKGTKHYLLKGLGVGLLAWLFLFGISYHTLPQTQTIAPKDVLSTISAFIGHSFLEWRLLLLMLN